MTNRKTVSTKGKRDQLVILLLILMGAVAIAVLALRISDISFLSASIF